MAAPAIGLLAGAVLAIRIVPRLAELAERVLGRGRGLVPALGGRQVARRPLRYTRAALLLVLAAALGTFASAHAATWTTSQVDQAAFAAGADLRVEPPDRPAIPDWAMGEALRALPGVDGRDARWSRAACRSARRSATRPCSASTAPALADVVCGCGRTRQRDATRGVAAGPGRGPRRGRRGTPASRSPTGRDGSRSRSTRRSPPLDGFAADHRGLRGDPGQRRSSSTATAGWRGSRARRSRSTRPGRAR